MKNLMTHLLIAAAALCATAASAPAQTIKAEVPFTFRANGKLMPPGTYRLDFRNKTGMPMIQMSGDSGQAVALMPISAYDPKKEWVATGNGLLSFQCGVSQCTLIGIWSGASVGLPAYSVAPGREAKDEPVRIALVSTQPDTR